MGDYFSRLKQKFTFSSSGINRSDPEEEKKLNLINLLLEVDLGANIIVGGMLLFLVAAVLAWKFNLTDYFYKNSSANLTENITPQVNFTPKEVSSTVTSASLYINQLPVSIDKAMSARPNKIKLTVNGQLKKEVFGFLPYWALDNLDDLNTNLLTTVSYFGLEIGGDGNVVVTNPQTGVDPTWQNFNDKKMTSFLRKLQRSRIKVLVTLKCFDNNNITKLVKSPEASQNFINNALYLVNSNNLDGINLDFEYVGQPPQEVIDGYSLLVSSLNKQLKKQYSNASLTVSTFANSASSSTIDDVTILSANSDGLVVMGYDFANPTSQNAGAVAPMDGVGFSLGAALNSYLNKVDPQKLILGVPYYGYDWPVDSSSKNASVTGNSSDVKVYTYAEIVDLTRDKNINWDDNTLTPWYPYTESRTGQPRIVHFENTRSLGIKYDYVNQKNLKGVAVWALGFDGKNNDLTQLLADKFANQ